jgi:predicted P-loop ATPase
MDSNPFDVNANAWLHALRKPDGKISSNESTLLSALQTCPETMGALVYDVRRSKARALRTGPWGDAGLWTSTMTARLAIYFQRLGIPAKEGPLDLAITVCADLHRVDPLKDWLGSLRWDGKPRLSKWLTTYAGAVDRPVVRLIARKFLIGAIARAWEPGVQMDTCLVLLGDQGAGKATMVRKLGGAYATGDLPDFHSRDAQQIAGSNWFIEVPDLGAVTRSHLDKLKAFLTQCFDCFIPKYERWPVTRPRWCVFIMSHNPTGGGFLIDPTGHRRMWPVEIARVLGDLLARDRDHLFAEALHFYRAGERWWPTTKRQWALLKATQAKHEIEDSWTPAIRQWLAENGETYRGTESLTTLLIATKALEMKIGDCHHGISTRIGTIMKKLEWPRIRQSTGERDWFYVNSKWDEVGRAGTSVSQKSGLLS